MGGNEEKCSTKHAPNLKNNCFFIIDKRSLKYEMMFRKKMFLLSSYHVMQGRSHHIVHECFLINEFDDLKLKNE